VLGEGDQIPDVTLFDEEARPVRLIDLATGGPFLLAFYLYDWTRT
jgi:peroxiredoxin